MGRLQGKVAIVTGGASGIGLGTVELFVAEGAKVMVGDIRGGAELIDRFPDAVAYLHTDVSVEADVEALVGSAVDHFGRLDVMFNNAGSAGDQSPILDLGAEGLDATLRLLVGSVVAGHRFAAREFIRQGGGGSIISTASGASFAGAWSTAAYTIAKHAVVGVVHQAAAELGEHGIRSNAIAPGITITPIMAKTFGVPADRAQAFTEHVGGALGHLQPLGRVGRPRDQAEAALFLASEASAWLTGTVIPVDGGLTAVTHSTLMKDLGAAASSFSAKEAQ